MATKLLAPGTAITIDVGQTARIVGQSDFVIVADGATGHVDHHNPDFGSYAVVLASGHTVWIDDADVSPTTPKGL